MRFLTNETIKTDMRLSTIGRLVVLSSKKSSKDIEEVNNLLKHHALGNVCHYGPRPGHKTCTNNSEELKSHRAYSWTILETNKANTEEHAYLNERATSLLEAIHHVNTCWEFTACQV